MTSTRSAEAISPLRRRMIEDMSVRKFGDKTRHDYIRDVESFAEFLGRSPDSATGEDLRRYQVHQTESGVHPPAMNGSVAALRFFFKITLGRADLATRLARVHYSSGIGTESDESAVLLYRLGLILPVHVTVEEYRSQSAVTQNSWSRHDPPYYVEGGDKTLVLGDLSVVGLTVFGEKFCNAVMGDVRGLYNPPDWAKELTPKTRQKET
jgi:hypothetical protein